MDGVERWVDGLVCERVGWMSGEAGWVSEWSGRKSATRFVHDEPVLLQCRLESRIMLHQGGRAAAGCRTNTGGTVVLETDGRYLGEFYLCQSSRPESRPRCVGVRVPTVSPGANYI